MAQSAGIVYQVQNSGDDTNGGGFRGGCELSTPSAPTVSAVSGGSVAITTYYVVITIVNGNGETQKSPETSVTTSSGNQTIQVTHPTDPGAVGSSWNIYISTTSGGPYWQQSTNNSFASNVNITSTPPTTGNQAPGIDYSLQNSAQVVIDNSTITATTPGANSNVLTFATGYTPTAADVGNIVHISGGTNIRAGWYEIIAYTSTTWTLTSNGNLTTAGGAGSAVTGKMGGAFATPGGLGAAFNTDGNTFQTGYIKYNATPYACSSTSNASGGRFNNGNNSFFLIGYDTTRTKDNTDANIPILNAGATSITVLTNSTFGASWTRRLKVTNTSAFTNVTAFQTSGYATQLTAVGCATGFNTTIGNQGTCTDCFAQNCSTGFNNTSGSGSVERCVSISNVANCSGFTSSSNNITYVDCLADNTSGTHSSGTGFGQQSNSYINCTARNFNIGFSNNASNSMRCVNCIAWNNVTDYWNQQAFTNMVQGEVCNELVNCAGQVLNGYHNWQLRNNVTLSVDPNTNPSGGDYSLNNTAGGGALCRAAGIPGSTTTTKLPGLSSTSSYPDLGPAQSAGGGASPIFINRKVVR